MNNRRGRERSRIEGFSDGVFAFAATLLVVSIDMPSTYTELTNHLSGFFGFGISFLALILLWSAHNSFFRRYGLRDTMSIVLNSVFLFVILFYLYPLRFLVNGLISFLAGSGAPSNGVDTPAEIASLFMLFSGGFAAVFACLAGLYFQAFKSGKSLNLSNREQHDAWVAFRYYGIFVTVGILSMLMAWMQFGIGIGAPGFLYLLLGPLCYFHSVRSEKEWQAKKETKPRRDPFKRRPKPNQDNQDSSHPGKKDNRQNRPRRPSQNRPPKPNRVQAN